MPDIVAFPYEIEVGPLAGETIMLAFKVPRDFGLAPPSGPLVSPHLMPITTAPAAATPTAPSTRPAGGLNDPGGTWQYWSRPFPTGRTPTAVPPT